MKLLALLADAAGAVLILAAGAALYCGKEILEKIIGN